MCARGNDPVDEGNDAEGQSDNCRSDVLEQVDNRVDSSGAAHSCKKREGGWEPGEWVMQKFFSDVSYFFSEMRR